MKVGNYVHIHSTIEKRDFTPDVQKAREKLAGFRGKIVGTQTIPEPAFIVQGHYTKEGADYVHGHAFFYEDELTLSL